MFAHIGNRTLTSCADKHMAASRRMLWRYLSLLNTNLVVGVAVVLNRCVLSGGGLAQIQSTEIPMPSIGATSGPGPYSWSSGHQQLEAAIQLPLSGSRGTWAWTGKNATSGERWRLRPNPQSQCHKNDSGFYRVGVVVSAHCQVIASLGREMFFGPGGATV